MNKKYVYLILMIVVLLAIAFISSCNNDLPPQPTDDSSSIGNVSSEVAVSSSLASSSSSVATSSSVSTSSSSVATSSSLASSSGSSVSGGDYIDVDYTGGSYQNGKIHYENAWGTKVDVSANSSIEFLLKDISGTVDWSKMKLIISDGAIGSEVILSGYVTGAMPNWTTINIPLTSFSASPNFSQLLYVGFQDAGGSGSAHFGVDEISFVGGSSVLFYGDAHDINAIENSTDVVLAKISGGTSSSATSSVASSSSSVISSTSSSATSSSSGSVETGTFTMLDVGYDAGGIQFENTLTGGKSLTFLTSEAVLDESQDYGLYTMDNDIWVVNGNTMSYTWDYTYDAANWYIKNAFNERTNIGNVDVRLTVSVTNQGSYLDLNYTVENISATETLDQISVHACLITRFHSDFPGNPVEESPGVTNWTEMQDRLYMWKNGVKFNYTSSDLGSVDEKWTAIMREGYTDINWSTWQVSANTTYTDNLIVVQSKDGQYSTGYAWESSSWASANCNSPASCIHLWPEFGSMTPGQVKSVKGRIYLIKGTPDDLYNMYVNDF